MKAVTFNSSLEFTRNYPDIKLKKGWALIKVLKAGICKTDIEIIKGYMGFKGVLGHEFIGIVAECENKNFLGKKVTAEINFSCEKCHWCKKGLGRHCTNRTTMGIVNADGCFAEYCQVPIHCLIEIPESISDNKSIFIEPLSAACEILEQLEGKITGKEKVYILGDGKLGILCSWVLSTRFKDVTLIGHHEAKLKIAHWNNIKTKLSAKELETADIVIEATGSVGGFQTSINLCKPRGILILKSTIAANEPLNLAMIVVNELTVIGSRCGLFKDGLNILKNYPNIPLERLITAEYPIEEVLDAFEKSSQKGVMKVIIKPQLPSLKINLQRRQAVRLFQAAEQLFINSSASNQKLSHKEISKAF